MKKLILLLSFTISFVIAFSQQVLTKVDGWNAYVYTPSGYSSTTTKYPVIIFMPGLGEVGTDASKLLVYGPSRFISQGWIPEYTINGVVEKPIVISIQPTSSWPSATTVNRKLDSIIKRWRVDTTRIYGTGLSMGAWAWQQYVSTSQTYSRRVTAMVPMSAPPPDNISNMKWLAQAGGKWWGFEGTQDGRRMNQIRDTMNKYVPGSARYYQYVGGHCCWNTWYDPAWTDAGDNIYTWMLKQKKGSTPQPPDPPTPGQKDANAGNDTTVYLNQTRPDTAILNGTKSTNVVSYSWSLVSGPNVPSISNPTSGITNVLNIVEGVYKFQLTVNGTSKDTVQVSVVDYMKKNIRPCRTGTPQSFTLTRTSAQEIYRPYITRDNILPNIQGGDTLYIPGGTYTGGIEIGDLGGGVGCPIIVAPKDSPVVLKNKAFLRFGTRDSAVVAYLKIDGTLLRSKGYPYGWVIDNQDLPDSIANSIGVTINWGHHIEVKGVNVNHQGVGMMFKLDSKVYPFGKYDKFILQNIKLHDNYFFRINGEGMYIGHTDPTGTQSGNSSGYGPPPRMDSVEIFNNIVDSTAWDGIQLSNALNNCKIYGNLVRKTGTLGRSSQRAGIISGANINGVQIYDNIIVNSQGGLLLFGYGNSYVYHNIIDSVRTGTNIENGMYIKKNNIYPEVVPSLVPSVTNNIIQNAEKAAIYLDYQPGTLGGNVANNYFVNNGSNTVTNNSGASVVDNTTLTTFPIKINSVAKMPLGYVINVTQGNATKNFTNVKALVDWLFFKLECSLN